MIYYKVTNELNQIKINKTTFILNELFTSNELNKLKINPNLRRFFEVVDISKKKTHFSFGCRFEKLQ